MGTYRVYQKQLSDSLQVQFVYENYPVFAGTNELSILIRFKYTGNISDINIDTQLKNPFNSTKKEKSEFVKVNTEVNNANTKTTETGWFGSRLSTQLSNATRSLFLQNLNTVSEEDQENESSKLQNKKEKEKIVLFLGYAQVLGHYLVNDKIINYSIFKDLEKSTIIEGKYAGISGLDANLQDSDENSGFLSGLNSLYNTEMNSSVNSKMVDDMKFLPFYSTNQNIVFSELVFDPNEYSISTNSSENVKSFYINCQLPKDLPPTYKTEAVQINYNFILGYQMMEGKNIISKTIFAPLKIQPFIDNCGRQPIYNLGKTKLNSIMESLIIEDISNHAHLSKHDKLQDNFENSTNEIPRRISFWNLKKKITKNKSRRSSSLSTIASTIQEKKRELSVTALSSIDDEDDDVSNFLSILDLLDKADVNDIIKVQEQFEKKMNETKSFKFNVRENLMQILADYKYVQRQKLTKKDFDEQLEYDYLLPKEQQIKYIIKQNHGIISTLSLNKGIFKLGDLINLNISFEGCKYETKGIEIQLLKHQIFNREEYLKKGSYDEVSPRLEKNILEIILFEKVMSTFNMKSINTDILIPSEAEPQFKTNFFISKYYLQARFIIVDCMGKSKSIDTTEHSKLEKNENNENTGNNENNESNNEIKSDLERKVFYDMKNIFIDTTGSMLFRAKEHLSNANEFYIRIPIVVLPTYEQDFGIVTTKI